MKILLQNTRTAQYIQTGTSAWTIYHADARDFNHSLDALMFCFTHSIRNMQILVEFADPRMNFKLPIADFKSREMSSP